VHFVDIENKERRIVEKLKIIKKGKTSKSLTKIKLEVDKLSKKVLSFTIYMGNLTIKLCGVDCSTYFFY